MLAREHDRYHHRRPAGALLIGCEPLNKPRRPPLAPAILSLTCASARTRQQKGQDVTDLAPIGGTISATLRTIAANIDSATERGVTLRPEHISPAEIMLLEALAAIGIEPVQQHHVARYALDFYFPDANLCIEVDGKQHQQRAAYDVQRDADLASIGIRTIRIPTYLILADAARIASLISDTLARAAFQNRQATA